MTCVSKCKIHIKLVNSATKFITSCSLRQVTTMSYPNIKSSTFFAILIVKFQIIECSFAIAYCPEDLELKPRGTSTNIEPPDYCKLLTCLPDPTINSKTKNLDFHEFLDQLEHVSIQVGFFLVVTVFSSKTWQSIYCSLKHLHCCSWNFKIHSFELVVGSGKQGTYILSYNYGLNAHTQYGQGQFELK